MLEMFKRSQNSRFFEWYFRIDTWIRLKIMAKFSFRISLAKILKFSKSTNWKR